MGFSDISAEWESSVVLHTNSRFYLTSCNSTLILISSCSHAARDLQEANSVIETTKLGCLERVFFSVATLVMEKGRGSQRPHHLQTHSSGDLSSVGKDQPGSTCQL